MKLIIISEVTLSLIQTLTKIINPTFQVRFTILRTKETTMEVSATAVAGQSGSHSEKIPPQELGLEAATKIVSPAASEGSRKICQ